MRFSQEGPIGNAANRFQGDYKRVLCVCSAGLLRSPTAALILSKPPYNYNTRACGIEESYALIPLSSPLLAWAQEIVCMGGDEHAERVKAHPYYKNAPRPVKALNLPDEYRYRDKQLIKLIKERYGPHDQT